MEKVRCNMYLPKALIDEIEKECERTGLNRTEYVIHVMLNHFDQQKTLKLVALAEASGGGLNAK